MRILFVDQFSELGGAQHVLMETVDAMQLAGWDARVLVPGSGSLVDALRARGIQTGGIPCGPYRSGSKSIADCMRFARDLSRQVRIVAGEIDRENIDLLYVNGPRVLPAVAMASNKRVPLVFHSHSHLRGAALKLTRWILRSSGAAVVGCSDSVVTPLRGHVDRESVHVIPNGVPDAGYHEREFDFRERLRVGIIGRIAPEKGQMQFIDAAALLAGEFPQAHFLIYGTPMFHSGRDYFEAVRLGARGLRVEFAGWQKSMSSTLREVDLLAAPSLDEGMGRVILEAFSAGVPVIAFPTGGIPEAVIDGVTGFLTRDRSGAALAARIRDVLAMKPENLQRVVRKARQAWGLLYSLGIYQQRITNLLETLVSKARGIEMPLQLR